MAKRFCGNGFALVKPATPFFSSARTAIGDIATAANNAAIKLAASSGGAPIDVTNKAPKGSSIIVIVSGSTAAAFVKLNRRCRIKVPFRSLPRHYSIVERPMR